MRSRGGSTSRVLLLLLVTSASDAAGQSTEFRAWVGLFNPESIGRLENENRLGDLCARVDDVSECYTRVMAPAVDVIALYPRPDTTASWVGELLVAVVPGRGISAFFRPIDSIETEWFEPDVFLQDWGYGPPYFHQTIIGEEGNWFQLPPGPWKSEVWILRGGEAANRTVLPVIPGDIVALDGRGMYVVDATSESLTMRPEQDADLWCREGDPPLLRIVVPQRYSRAELLDSEGHLRIRPKYMKGC